MQSCTRWAFPAPWELPPPPLVLPPLVLPPTLPLPPRLPVLSDPQVVVSDVGVTIPGITPGSRQRFLLELLRAVAGACSLLLHVRVGWGMGFGAISRRLQRCAEMLPRLPSRLQPGR